MKSVENRKRKKQYQKMKFVGVYVCAEVKHENEDLTESTDWIHFPVKPVEEGPNPNLLVDEPVPLDLRIELPWIAFKKIRKLK